MGFPKPWPTEWPEPVAPPCDPDDLPEYDPDTEITYPGEDEPPESIPEYRRRFRSVTWAVNHACNLRCTHCYDVVPQKRGDLDTSDALALIDRLAEAGVEFIAFSGGEAFLRRDLFELMGHAAAKGLQIGARSNGTKITPLVATRLRELGIAVVGVSFDGATPETHDAVRGAGAFAAAMAGLRALRAEGIRAQMEVVLSRANAHEADEFVALGEQVGASEVNFSAMTPQGRGATQPKRMLDHALWQQLTARLREKSRNASIPVTPNCAFVGECFANIEPHVTCDGWMSPCYLSTKKLFRVLDTPPNVIRAVLEGERPLFQDVCGRRAWTRPPRQTLGTARDGELLRL